MDEFVVILRSVLEKPEITQRELAEKLHVSLGKLNQRMQEAKAREFLVQEEEGRENGRNARLSVSGQGLRFLSDYRVDAAIILAAGFGSRFVPLSFEQPKGLLEVFGERMIERQIRQLREAGVGDIVIVVGYMKEKFDYLIDDFGVRLLYNPEYAEKNNLASLWHAMDELRGRNCYVLSSDHWMRENLYHAYEPHAWYAAAYMEGPTREWALRFGKDGRIREVRAGGEDAFCMYGPAYFSRAFSDSFLPLVDRYYHMPGTEQYYWEDVLLREIRSIGPMYVNRQRENVVYEFENLEELRRFDQKYLLDSGSPAMRRLSSILGVPESDIVGIMCLKAGMTNKSFLFHVREDSEKTGLAGRPFICRIPGPGTEKLINRKQEAEVYREVSRLSITEELIYFDPDSGYKLSRYYRNARNADFSNEDELRECMSMLKTLHNSGLSVGHGFSLRERLRFYEGLCLDTGHEIPFEDYPKIRLQAEELLRFTEGQDRPRVLCHIDSVKDNFIFTEEGLRMIDWEYAGMADPLLDLAMSAIYSYMSFSEAEKLYRIYRDVPWKIMRTAGHEKGRAFSEAADAGGAASEAADAGGSPAFYEDAGGPGIAFQGAGEDLFPLVIAYMGLSGLLWALWCSYKISLGENFGDYTLKMYRYFKDSFRRLRIDRKI